MTASTQGPGPGAPGARPTEPTSTTSTTTPPGGTVSGSPASGGTPTPPSSPPGSQAGSTAKATADEARKQAEDVRDQAEAKGHDLKQQAREAAEKAKERARSAAYEQKNQAAERVSGFASALRSACADLDQQGQTVASGFVRQAAEGLDNVSGAIRNRDFDDFVETVEGFARRQPVVFLGGAVLAGFGIARFVKSSSERRYARSSSYDPSGRTRREGPGDPGAPYGGTPYEGGL